MTKAAKAGKPKPKVPDYCDVEPRRDANGQAKWPAEATAIEGAREWIREWYTDMVLGLSMTDKLQCGKQEEDTDRTGQRCRRSVCGCHTTPHPDGSRSG